MITSNWQNKSSKSFTVENGINIFWAPVFYNNKMGFFRRIASFFQFVVHAIFIGLKLDYDLIIASSTPLTVGIPALFFKRIKSKKLIFEVRDMWPQLPIAMGFIKSKILIHLSRYLERKIYRQLN